MKKKLKICLLVFTARCYASTAYAVMRCLSVRLFVHSVETNKRIFKFFTIFTIG